MEPTPLTQTMNAVAPSDTGPPRKRRAKRWLSILAMTVAMLASTMAIATPQASASEWHEISRSESCHTYSFGTICTVEQTTFRQHNSYCANGPEYDWNAYQYMEYGMFCFRYNNYTYFA